MTTGRINQIANRRPTSGCVETTRRRRVSSRPHPARSTGGPGREWIAILSVMLGTRCSTNAFLKPRRYPQDCDSAVCSRTPACVDTFFRCLSATSPGDNRSMKLNLIHDDSHGESWPAIAGPVSRTIRGLRASGARAFDAQFHLAAF